MFRSGPPPVQICNLGALSSGPSVLTAAASLPALRRRPEIHLDLSCASPFRLEIHATSRPCCYRPLSASPTTRFVPVATFFSARSPCLLTTWHPALRSDCSLHRSAATSSDLQPGSSLIRPSDSVDAAAVISHSLLHCFFYGTHLWRLSLTPASVPDSSFRCCCTALFLAATRYAVFSLLSNDAHLLSLLNLLWLQVVIYFFLASFRLPHYAC